MKYEEAYHIGDKRCYTLEEIQSMFHYNIRRFAEHFRENLVCPECHKVRISYSHAKTPYFKAVYNDGHDYSCSFKEEALPQKQAKSYVNDMHNADTIKRRLESILSLLFTPENTHAKSIDNQNESMSIQTDIALSGKVKRQPGMKHIDRSLESDDYGCYKYFYGCVNVNWAIRSNDYLLTLKNRNKDLCKIRITHAVYAHIPQKYKDIHNERYNIVFLAELDKSDCPFTSLRYSHFLVLSKYR